MANYFVDYAKFNSALVKNYPNLKNTVETISNYKKLERWELKEALTRAKQGDGMAEERIIENYSNFVLHMAYHFFEKFGGEIEDYLSEGRMGLLEAVRRYDKDRNNTFMSYASSWSLQKMTRSIPNCRYVARLPMHVFEEFQKIYFGKVLATEAKWGKFLTLLELQINRILSPEDIRDVPDNSFEDEIVSKIDNERLVAEAFRNLNPRGRFIMEHRYGFYDGTVWTLEEIAKELNVTRERV